VGAPAKRRIVGGVVPERREIPAVTGLSPDDIGADAGRARPARTRQGYGGALGLATDAFNAATGTGGPPWNGASLPLVYLVWALVVVVLYFPCRWFAAVKARRHDWWLRYL
jgi:hypothetical protein